MTGQLVKPNRIRRNRRDLRPLSLDLSGLKFGFEFEFEFEPGSRELRSGAHEAGCDVIQ